MAQPSRPNCNHNSKYIQLLSFYRKSKPNSLLFPSVCGFHCFTLILTILQDTMWRHSLSRVLVVSFSLIYPVSPYSLFIAQPIIFLKILNECRCHPVTHTNQCKQRKPLASSTLEFQLGHKRFLSSFHNKWQVGFLSLEPKFNSY